MSQDHRSSHPHRRPSPTRRRPERRTTEREMVQSDELSSTSGARLISNENPYDPSMNPHASSSFPAIPSAGTPHPKSPAARARQQYEAGRTGDIPRITIDSTLPPSYTGEQPAVGHDHVAPSAHHTGGIPRIYDEGRPNSTDSIPAVERTHTGSFRSVNADAQQAPASHTGRHARVEATPRPSQTGRTPRVTPHVSQHAGQTGQHAPVMAAHAEAHHSRARRRNTPRLIAIVVAVLAIFVVVFGINQAIYASPVEATVNGEKMTLEGNQRSIAGLLDENIVSVTPGNYVAVDNSVIREGDGNRCTALINEQEVDLNGHINEGDSVVISNGSDIMEEFVDSEPTILPAGYTREDGWGALHVFLPGQDGEMVTRTGSESGITVEQVTKEKIDERLVYYNADTNGEKVVALTFDDGPWDTTTEQILDILKENGAKATFYTIGDQVSQHSDQIKRMAEEGHEIATHTWDHAAGSGNGVSLDLMSTIERQQEVEKGLTIIEEISGKDASIFFRAPGGNFSDSTATDLMSPIDGEIGWNVDTEDWRRPGSDVIAQRIMSVKPGGIVLMHDGGGDRSETVAGLREAISYLKEQGYKFITISELIEQYPYQAITN